MDLGFDLGFDLDGFLSLFGFLSPDGFFFLAEGGADLAEDGADLAEEGLAEPGLADRWSSAKQRLSQILRLSLIHCMQCLSDICGQTSSGPNWDPQL